MDQNETQFFLEHSHETYRGEVWSGSGYHWGVATAARIDVRVALFDVIQVEQLAGTTCCLYSVMETDCVVVPLVTGAGSQ